jgi:hypothetical protein
LLLFAIFALELAAITARYQAPALLANDASWSAGLFLFSKELCPLALWIIGACFLILSPQLQLILSDLREQSHGYRWLRWLALHTFVFAGFAVVTALIFEIPTNPARLSGPWFAGWFALAIATLLLWLLALAPSHFWLRLIRQQHMTLLIGSLLGMCA